MLAVPHSAAPGIAWPAITQGYTARQLALQYQFRQSERWEPDQIRAHQFAQLRQMLTHADRTMPFWRARLRAAGITPDTPLTEATWSRIPILTRAEAQDAGTALHCLSPPPEHGPTEHASTSGSTGRPLSVLKTALHQIFWNANLLREMAWHRFDVGAKMAIIRRDLHGDPGPGKGRRLPDWGPAISAVWPTGPAVLFDVRKPIHEQAAWLRQENPDYLLTFVSNLALLAQHFRDTGAKLPRLRGLRTFAEVLTPDLRDLCQEVFGVGITDFYSSEEVGYIALQCPAHPHLHALAETVRVEVVNTDGLPCAPGEVGRVIVTPLHNFAMPLLRYELGDMAEAGPPCDCGRHLPVLRQILGRARNRVLLPNGESRFAFFGGKYLNTLPYLRQCQVVQKTRTDIELKLVVRRPPSPAEEAAIIGIIRDSLGYPFQIQIAYVDEIPRSPSGKFEDFKSEAI